MTTENLRITKPQPGTNVAAGLDFSEIGTRTPNFTPKVLSLRKNHDKRGDISPRKPAVKNIRRGEGVMKWPSLMMKRRRKRFDSADYELEKLHE
mmetsp:Transcript_833/g.1018  ORF Transcript_833/g.1018 Transcript_833/m.1018 type:complete len:94 (-) Transcript_833:591-872(-)|eukprot:CAMPEP_0184028114 /NCGR_PEP_ID=MMETSP0954-20121128/14618_1 /TAXON_ID=627963 /ORGANISM="Aplanochytrium sp, Strain PBS07" /LENGTH=93 /DNA_ID=CAMNT_0026312837 /DNA_START=386 /DNA_END=667 /DNA_ORIENTATION=+